MKIAATIALAVLLAGCGMRIPTLFHVPVLQGNVVDEEKVRQLELGMTPPQVRYLLGTPLIDSSFDEHRWDYVFYYRNRDADVVESQLSLFFEDDELARIEGDEGYRAMLPEETRELDVDKLNRDEPQRQPTAPPGPRPAPEPTPGPGPYGNPDV